MSQKHTPSVPRKVVRTNADAAPSDFVEFDATTDPSPLDAKEDWPVTDWQSSSYALLTGCQVKDYTARIPDRVFNALFKDE
jgi:hypothetical protein